MLVKDLMTRSVSSCRPENNLGGVGGVDVEPAMRSAANSGWGGKSHGHHYGSRYLYCTWDEEHQGIGRACT